jgi:hypothetical protein
MARRKPKQIGYSRYSLGLIEARRDKRKQRKFEENRGKIA